jgi:CheY-like chemotaxis protein
LTPVHTKFLLADDDADDASLFCEALCRIASDIECYQVENGSEVLDFLSSEQNVQPDVIFLDINMPIMNGWDCLRKLQNDSKYRAIPTIVYSTSSTKKDVDTAYSLGASLFLTKPEDFNELCKIVEIVATNPHDRLVQQLQSFESVKMG